LLSQLTEFGGVCPIAKFVYNFEEAVSLR
jgi:hypothetical protein